MSFYRDLTGRQFGRLTVLREANRGNNGGSTWICRCSCGNIEAFKGNRLLSGHNKRCGECGYGMFEFFDNDRRVRCVLPHGKGFIFDSEDLSLVCQFKWFIDALGYPKTSAGICGPSGKHLHTLLMNPEKGMLVDHVDGNKLNNCRDNLRVCSHAQNIQNQKISVRNTSGYKGVSYDKSRRKWTAYITALRKRHFLGRFNTAKEAALAYDKAASFYFGEFARPNFS